MLKQFNLIIAKIEGLLDNIKTKYVVIMFAIFIFSLSSLFIKLAGTFAYTSVYFYINYAIALGCMLLYAVLWQLLLERMPLFSVYINRGFSYILVFVWSFMIFHEQISLNQIIGMVIILLGLWVCQHE